MWQSCVTAAKNVFIRFFCEYRISIDWALWRMPLLVKHDHHDHLVDCDMFARMPRCWFCSHFLQSYHFYSLGIVSTNLACMSFSKSRWFNDQLGTSYTFERDQWGYLNLTYIHWHEYSLISSISSPMYIMLTVGLGFLGYVCVGYVPIKVLHKFQGPERSKRVWEDP